MRNRVDAEEENSDSVPSNFVRGVGIDLKHPTGADVAKKIA